MNLDDLKSIRSLVGSAREGIADGKELKINKNSRIKSKIDVFAGQVSKLCLALELYESGKYDVNFRGRKDAIYSQRRVQD